MDAHVTAYQLVCQKNRIHELEVDVGRRDKMIRNERTELAGVLFRLNVRADVPDDRPACEKIAEKVAELERDVDGLHQSSIHRYQAEGRALLRWQAANPGKGAWPPGHEDLVVWLLDEVVRLEAVARGLETSLAESRAVAVDLDERYVRQCNQVEFLEGKVMGQAERIDLLQIEVRQRDREYALLREATDADEAALTRLETFINAAGLQLAPSLFEHYKGGTYEKLMDAALEIDGTSVVVYRSKTTGIVWVRSRTEFEEKFVQLAGDS